MADLVEEFSDSLDNTAEADQMISKIDSLVENNTDDRNPDSYQVFVTDMKWSDNSIRNIKKGRKAELPVQMTYDLPDGVLKQLSKKKTVEDENDLIEQHVYNALTKKFGFELNHAQIWILF